MSGRFRFRLQPVLDHRERIVDERRRAYAATLHDLARAEAHGLRLAAERDGHRASLAIAPGAIDTDRLRAVYAYLAHLETAIESHAERIAACRAETEAARAALVAADTDRNVLETLKAHRFAAFTAECAQAEQRDIDDENARRSRRLSPGRVSG